MKKLSLVIPAYNESAGIELFHASHLLPVLKKLKLNYEVIYVNDGSTDDTLTRLQAIAKKNTDIKIIALSRNFGKEIATTAGIHQAAGDAVMILDADGQHPPELIPNFVEKWQQGAQVVIGVRGTNQKEGFVKRYGSKLFYKLFNNSSENEIIPGSTDFRLIDREVADAFILMQEKNRITRGLIDWLGFNRTYIEFDAPARIAGEAGYSVKKLLALAFNSFVSLSLKPLLAVGWLGIVIILLALVSGCAIFVEQYLLGDPLGLNFTGSALLGIFISFLVGLSLVSQGILALYISHIHAHAQNRPLYIINKATSKNI